ncbi:MAG: cobalt ECF transporter T component CbiQ [Deltaproteobacteria bacterium]|nr:cobalt ECF transporter T component CbiQ [Deltaproteobacteria bacterium]
MQILSEYFKKDHFLSRIDARVKLLIALALLVMVLSYHGFVFPVATAIICLFLCMAIKVPLRVFILRFSEPLFIAAIVVLLKLFFSGQDALFSLNIFGAEIVGHRDGFREGLLIGTRIIGAVSVIAVLGFSTPFTEFMAGLSWFRVPKGFIEILMFAYRYIFVLFEDAQVIYQAQKNRLGYSTVRRGLSSFGTLAGTLTIKAFDHSQSTTVAMVQRGYEGDMPMLKHKPFKATEVTFSVLFVIAMGVVWKM